MQVYDKFHVTITQVLNFYSAAAITISTQLSPPVTQVKVPVYPYLWIQKREI